MEYTFAGLPLPLRIKPPYPLTDDQLLRFSEEHKPLPIERDTEGWLLLMTPAGATTANKNAYISAKLYSWAEEQGRGMTFDSSAGFTLRDGSMRNPDAAWLSLAKWQAISSEQQERYASVCPEFVIELRSPSDPLTDLQTKMQMWIDNGTELAWLIDPQNRTVTFYRPGREPELLESPMEVRGEGPIAGFVLPLSRIFF